MGSRSNLREAFWEQEFSICHEGVTFTTQEQTRTRNDISDIVVGQLDELPLFDDFDIQDGCLTLYRS